ncbi:carbohydrate ABC transporter permease [Cryobacterium sp. TMT2-4]|uniref:carbohydrate ABC transporter permease n=1 Tax=Cryobacterium sp. TMT2-4 TaxID=1259254 RepID=UPI00106CF587|nr:carbohydrate ABC transporter permease [Cryobacterium sp. TMT2-4]TFC70532.1 carbohydrate ABC transporter permease [Cryobacterium sp. TMT2-4]
MTRNTLEKPRLASGTAPIRSAAWPSVGGRRRNRGDFLGAVARHSILIAVLVVFLAPLVFIITTSLMTNDQALTSKLWPNPIEWSNFAQIFEAVPLLRYFANTVTIAVLFTVLSLISSIPVAYALSKFRFRGRNALFMVFIAAMMLPPQVTVVPLYTAYANLGWTGTPLPLIIPALFGDAFTIFLLRQFFVSVPQGYIDAARLDGASELRILWSVFIPMVKPAIAAAGLFVFFYTWNDFFNPLLYLGSNPDWYTLSIALSQFRSVHAVQWNLAMAATLLFVLPVLILFFFAQKSFVQGIALSGVKE